jgi:predicted nucleic acid-binding protein
MEVLIDTNIVLDWFIKREPFYETAKTLLSKCWFSNIRSYLTVHSICDLFYIIDKKFDTSEKKKLLQLLINRNDIISESKSDIECFIKKENWTDLEDGLQMQSAENYKLDYIITRNILDFQNSSVPAIEPEAFLKLL